MDEKQYKNLAQLVVSRIGERHYFNGTLCAESEACSVTLRASLIIYRKQLCGPDCPPGATRITDIVPVWWEFEQTDADGNLSHDFSWSEFRPFLMSAI